MTSFHTILKFLVGHILAGAVIILGTLFLTFVWYIAGLATAPHGIDNPVGVIPEFLTLMFMTSVFAVIASTASFLISIFFQWLRSKRHFPVWLPPIVVPLLIFLVALLTLGPKGNLAFVWLMTGTTFVYFSIYWGLLTSAEAMLDFLKCKFSKPTTA